MYNPSCGNYTTRDKVFVNSVIVWRLDQSRLGWQEFSVSWGRVKQSVWGVGSSDCNVYVLGTGRHPGNVERGFFSNSLLTISSLINNQFCAVVMKTERFLAFRFCQTFEHEICVPYFKFSASIPIVFISLNNFVPGWKRENCSRSGCSGTKVLQLYSNIFLFFRLSWHFSQLSP